ncbi:hypothetical protein V497_07443 [Pseudogymnoascus sp. VKM F-4516 (FW-969)]|nr:hypothetical protein V497_07443 [Pseudogymnoascus sp. VKM F-4516 (FW-969)]
MEPSLLIRVLQGVVAATKASTNILIEGEIWILQIAANTGVSNNSVGGASQRPDLSLNFWLSAVSNNRLCAGENNGLLTVLSLTVAVSALQQLSRKGVTASESELSLLWNTIYDALTNTALQDSWSPSRSAQGFLSVPLCSIIKDGQIDELFRLHVWLPDYHRGNPDFAIHSHQPFVQSWILAGEGTDHQYQVDRVNHASKATHAEFSLSWSDGKNLSKEYITHQRSSVIVNSGKLVQSTEIKSNVHARNSSYTIPAGVFHRTEVPSNAIHATLFYFDSSRGFVQDAPVLGPIDGVPVTQIRDPAGQTPKSLAESVLLVQTWETFIEEGRNHSSTGAWEHSQRAFNSALSLIDGATDSLNLKRYRGLTLGELGKTNRRFGRYEVAERFLQDACAGLINTPEHASLSGELGVVYRHMNRLSDAKDSFKLQYDTAKSLNIETEICRAIGNLGMVSYQLWETSQDDETLRLAIQQLQERVIRCENIRTNISATSMDATSASQLSRQLDVWAAVALARLSLCFSARGDDEESFNTAAAGLQHAKRTGDPSVIAISHFFCGRASSLKGDMEEALRSFNACEGCTPAIAFCKEPSKEHHKYLEYMIAAGANMEIMDSDGYKALDYAIFNGDKTSADLVLTGLRRQFSERGNAANMLIQWQEESKRRKGYRELFQEKLRPTLLAGDQDCIAKLRAVYADALVADQDTRELFDWFKTIPYPSFASFGRLPRSSDNITEKFAPDRQDGSGGKQKFVIFFSYRWLHSKEGPGAGMADDAHHTQYSRMKRSVEDLLIIRPDIVAEDLHVWMDFACIDQDASQKGVAALPLFLAQCDIVISLIDDQYYDRAWCCVEALMIKRLRGSYNTHLWYEQVSKTKGIDEKDEKGLGIARYERLREVSMELEIEVAEKKLSYESDREKIIFLERQSLLVSMSTGVSSLEIPGLCETRKTMDSQKLRKRSKWLSRAFGKKETSEPAQTSKLATVGPSSGSSQALPHGTTRPVKVTATATATSEPPPPPYTESHENTAQSATVVQTTENVDLPQSLNPKDGDHSGLLEGKAEDPRSSDVKVATHSDIEDSNQPNPRQISRPQTPAKGKGVLNAPTIAALSAPAIDTRTAKGSSRTKKPEFKDEEAVPRILDPKVSMKSAGFWEKTYIQMSSNKEHEELFVKYEAILDENSPSKADNATFPQKMEANVQKQISVMKQRQWVLQWDKKSIVIRDQAERIVKFVRTFSALGNAIANIDPIHVGIPWAGVCAVLTLVLNDSTQHQDALNGIEDISTIIGKYIAIEDIYVQSLEVNTYSESNAAFEKCIINVYSSVLLFQVKAALHFHRRTMARTVSNIVKSVDWTELLSSIRKCDAECLAMASMAGTSNLTSGISSVSENILDIQQKWKDIEDIGAIVKKLEAGWENKQKNIEAMIEWISEVQVGIEHERARTSLGERYWNSGQWFLHGADFMTWKTSIHGSFWLQGSVGTGKTSLASIVLNELIKSGENPSVGFFYCRATGEVPNNPTAIFRSLVAQLAFTLDGDDVYPLVRDWYQKEAKHYVTGSRLTISQCEDLLVRLMTLRGKTIILIDGIDECSAPMELLRSLHTVWKNFPELKVFLTSRLDVEVSSIFHKIPTVQSEVSKTSDDIREYITQELHRKERRNKKVITNELAERMTNILTKRAQGMFRWVELQLDLLINSERRIKYRKDFEDRLDQLEHGSGQEVLDSLRETYDLIYARNTQGPYSRRVAEKALKWVLCAARPLKIWELGAAVCVDGEDKVKTDLIVSICSNFFIVDLRGFVQLAHLSVREYLEVKEVDGKLIYSPEETHAAAAYTCLLYFKNVARLVAEQKEYDVDVDVDEVETSDEDEDTESDVDDNARKEEASEVDSTAKNDTNEADTGDKKLVHEDTDSAYCEPAEAPHERDLVQEEADRMYREVVEARKAASSLVREEERDLGYDITDVTYREPAEAPEERYLVREEADRMYRGVVEARRAASSPVGEEGEDMNANAIRSPYDGPNADYFGLADEYLKADLAPKLEPREAIKRFQRYASIYWATHCEAAKKFRTDESSTLYELFWEFLEEDGKNPVFQQWAIALFNESKLASLPTINPAPMIFIPTTAHDQHILDAEPMYNRWADIITHVGGLQPLEPSIPLIACSYGFIDVLEEISEDGSALLTCNHQGIPAIVLATRNGFDEVLDLPIPLDLDLDVRDKVGRTPLHHAALNGSLALARILLGYPRKASRRPSKNTRHVRVDMNVKDICGRTPLHIAAEYGQLEVLKLLLQEEKVDVHVRNNQGYTALGMCATKPELARFLKADRRYTVEDEFECDGVGDGYIDNINAWYRMDKGPSKSDEEPINVEGSSGASEGLEDSPLIPEAMKIEGPSESNEGLEDGPLFTEITIFTVK